MGNKGTTLIETIIYIAIVSIVVVSFVMFSISISDIRNKTYAGQEVQSNARVALNILSEKIRVATVVNSASVFDVDPGTLSLDMYSDTDTPTVFYLDQNDGTLYIKEGSSLEVPLTSDEVKIINLIFRDLTNSDGNGNVQVDMTVEYNSDTSDVGVNYSKSFRTAVNVRGSSTAPPSLPSQTPTTITLLPATLTFTNTNQTSNLTATVFDQNGDAMTGQSITFSSSNTSIATVNSSGLVTSKGVGSATITATSGSLSDTTSVNVTVPLVPTTMTLTPASLSFDNVSQTAQLTTKIYDQNGDLMTGQSVTYTSSNTSVAIVNSSGLVTSKGAGNTVITATSGSLSDTTGVSVTVPVVLTPTTLLLLPSGLSFNNVNQTSQLTAAVYDQNGDLMTGQSITFSSSNVTIATVSTGGLVTSEGFGNTTITATSGSLSDATNVSVVWKCTGRFCDDFGGGF